MSRPGRLLEACQAFPFGLSPLHYSISFHFTRHFIHFSPLLERPPPTSTGTCWTSPRATRRWRAWPAWPRCRPPAIMTSWWVVVGSVGMLPCHLVLALALGLGSLGFNWVCQAERVGECEVLLCCRGMPQDGRPAPTVWACLVSERCTAAIKTSRASSTFLLLVKECCLQVRVTKKSLVDAWKITW